MTSNQFKDGWGARKYERTRDKNYDAAVPFTSSLLQLIIYGDMFVAQSGKLLCCGAPGHLV